MDRAVRMVQKQAAQDPSQWAAMEAIAPKLGCRSETLRKWVRQAERDAGQRAGLTTQQRERLKMLEPENRELARANDSLRKAAACFAQTERDRRPSGCSTTSTSSTPRTESSRSAACCRSPPRRTAGIRRAGSTRAVGRHEPAGMTRCKPPVGGPGMHTLR